jgi:formylglycine-generating enzyme required for sulfatase activity
MKAVKAAVCVALVLGFASRSPAQTARGDILRARGDFLQGAGLYRLYSAEGRSIDADTAIKLDRWNREVYDAYVRARAAHIAYGRNLTSAAAAKAQRALAERETRYRIDPTDVDIVSGEALNALLVDLSNPSIPTASWASNGVPLVEGASIHTLSFRFAPRVGDNASLLKDNLIALGRLDSSRGWPTFLPPEYVGRECKIYEDAHRAVLAQCQKGQLKLPTVLALDHSLDLLQSKVAQAVPEARGFRAAAVRYVKDMKAATKVFDATTIDFVQEMIRDAHDYQPQTVAELLGFMRKYRLLFASAENRPDDGEMYRIVYDLLRKQKEQLGRKNGAGPAQTAAISNSLGMRLALIPAGEFLMGSPDSDKDAWDCERPQHRVRITRPFYLGTTEVTVGQFRRVVEAAGYRTEAERDGKGGFGLNETNGHNEQDPRYTWRNPGFAQMDEHPVVDVSWNDAIQFCNKLSEREGLKPYYQSGTGASSGGVGYRLPTEVEWEYACRAGTTTRYSFGDDEKSLGEYAWYQSNWGPKSHPVGQKPPNAFGLYDMHGNVWEWCWDGYDEHFYANATITDPAGPSQAKARVFRGGGWSDFPRDARSANRGWSTPDFRNVNLGFRVARDQSSR